MSTPQIYTKKIKKLNLSNKNMPLSGTIDYGNIGVDGVELPPNIFASPLPLLPIDSFYRRLDGVYTRSPLPVSSTSEKIENVNKTIQPTTTLTTTKNNVNFPSNGVVTVSTSSTTTTTTTPNWDLISFNSENGKPNSIVTTYSGEKYIGTTHTSTTKGTTTRVTTTTSGRVAIISNETLDINGSTTADGMVVTSTNTLSTTPAIVSITTSHFRNTKTLTVTIDGQTYTATPTSYDAGASYPLTSTSGINAGTVVGSITLGQSTTTIEITSFTSSSSSQTAQTTLINVSTSTFNQQTPTTVTALTTMAPNTSVAVANFTGQSMGGNTAQIQPFLAPAVGSAISWLKEYNFVITTVAGVAGIGGFCIVGFSCLWHIRNRVIDIARAEQDRARADQRIQDDILRQSRIGAATIYGRAESIFVDIENDLDFDPPYTQRDADRAIRAIERFRNMFTREAREFGQAVQGEFRRPYEDTETRIGVRADELIDAVASSLSIPPERGIVPPHSSPIRGERRLQNALDIPEQDLLKIDTLALALDSLTKLSAHSSLKISLIETICKQIAETLSDPALAINSRKYIVDKLLPIYTQEADSVVIWQLENNSVTDLWNAKLDYSPTTYLKKEIWDIDYAKSISSISTFKYSKNFFFELNKPIFKGSGSSTRMIHLDDINTQYLGSEAKDIVFVSGKGGNNYNIATGAGDDIVYISNEVFKYKDSTVNILGGTGANTYVIQLKDGWSNLLGSIHIWDFDSSKDKIILDSAGSFQNPNINLSKVIHYFSPFISSPAKENGQIELTSATPGVWDRLFSKAHTNKYYKAVSYAYSGNGVPNIILDQSSTNIPTKEEIRRLADASVFKSNYLGDVLDSTNTDAYLSTETTPQTIYSQFDSINDHDFYRVSLHKGGSYTFSLDRPFTPAPPVHRDDGAYTQYEIALSNIQPNPTSLVIRNMYGFVVEDYNGIIRSAKEGGSCRIDFVSPYDGDFYLDASGYLKGNGNGINHDNDYTITTVAIPREQPSYHNDSTTIGITDENCGYASYSLDLKAGDFYKYQLIGDTSSVFLPHISIKDPNTFNVLDARVFKDNTNQYITGFSFLATQTGKYLIDIVDPNFKGRIFYSGHAYDIPGDLQTGVFLPKDTAINSKIDFAGDHDVFKMHITQGNYIDWYADGELTLTTKLKDKQGNVLFDSNWYGDGMDNQYLISETDDYYIDVSSLYEQSLGKYCFQYSVINSAI